ncbi:type VI secretion lipoprotein TssJ, partial [Serratia marcescens]|uniref:type VI secretion lipoprotein TssJ n=1 Tax=Serratia marcescens TaxID=615 RepID=UPI0011E6D0ED
SAGAITLQLRAEPALNTFHDLPGSCTVLLVQAADRGALDKVLTNPVTLKSLFAGAGGEGEVLQVDRYVMMPGQSNTLHVDRAINTRSLALVAGYYPFPTKQHMLRVDIPVETTQSGWFSPVWHASLSPVTLTVVLGKESIVDASHS